MSNTSNLLKSRQHRGIHTKGGKLSVAMNKNSKSFILFYSAYRTTSTSQISVGVTDDMDDSENFSYDNSDQSIEMLRQVDVKKIQFKKSHILINFT